MPTEHPKRLVNHVDRAFAEAITYFRAQAGLRQQDIADQLGVSHQQYQKYEHGTNRITIGRAAQIANALDVPLPVLIEMAGLRRDWRVDRDAGRMMQFFQRIHDKEARMQLSQLAEHFARLSQSSSEQN